MMVLDASVAAKWFLPEPGSAEAVALQEGPHQLTAPELIRLEVCAAITRHVRDPKEPISPEAAAQRCAKWLELLDAGAVVLIPEDELIRDAIQLAIEVKHPLQDCLYLAAAVRGRLPLVTADEQFYRRAGPAFPNVRTLLPLKA